MKTIKRQYQAPAFVDQGSVVALTMADPKGHCWDGSPSTEWDFERCGADDDTSIPQ